MKLTSFTPKPEILASLERPAALTGVNPRSIEGTRWWRHTRERIYRSTRYHCAACGAHKSEAKHRQWLEAHESYRIDFARGIIELDNIWPLCHFCHRFIHRERILTLYKNGKVTAKYCGDVLAHGVALLDKHRILHELQKIPVHNIEWQAWRLYYKGSWYCSKFESENQKNAYYEWLMQANLSSTNENLETFLKVWDEVKASHTT